MRPYAQIKVTVQFRMHLDEILRMNDFSIIVNESTDWTVTKFLHIPASDITAKINLPKNYFFNQKLSTLHHKN